MPNNNLNDLNIIALITTIGFGIWSAMMNYIGREKNGKEKIGLKQKVLHFIIDVISSTGIAMLTFLLMQGVGFNELISVGISGLMAYEGTRGITFLQIIFAEKIGATKTAEYLRKKNDT